MAIGSFDGSSLSVPRSVTLPSMACWYLSPTMLSVICGPWPGIDRPLSDVSRHVPCSADGVIVCCVSKAMRLAAIAIPAIVAMKDFMSILILTKDPDYGLLLERAYGKRQVVGVPNGSAKYVRIRTRRNVRVAARGDSSQSRVTRGVRLPVHPAHSGTMAAA